MLSTSIPNRDDKLLKFKLIFSSESFCKLILFNLKGKDEFRLLLGTGLWGLLYDSIILLLS